MNRVGISIHPSDSNLLKPFTKKIHSDSPNRNDASMWRVVSKSIPQGGKTPSHSQLKLASHFIQVNDSHAIKISRSINVKYVAY
jgi:hypothetical protein